MRSVFRSLPIGLAVVGLLAFDLAAVVFAVGSVLADPGGWLGVGLVVVCLTPVLAAMAAVWCWPERVGRGVVALAVAAVTAVVVSGLWASGWRSVERRWGGFGPSLIPGAVLAVGAVAAVLALHRHRLAGRLLTLLGTGSVAVGLLRPTSAALVIIGLPVLTAGVVIWTVSGRVEVLPTPPQAVATSE